MMEKAKADTQYAMEVWSDILPLFFESRLEYVYTKGSAVKPWDSHIDYVPTISDVDIHVGFTDDDSIFGKSRDDFDTALKISKQCESEFIERRPDHLHVPRMQVMETRFLMKDERYTPPRLQDIQVLYGEPQLQELPNSDVIRTGDLERVFEDMEFIDDMPRRIFDRTGLDFWAFMRLMCWRVSPSPVRILTQNNPDPIDVWSWNRTRIHRKLLEEGYDKIAEHYFGFYDSGWRLYLSEFKDLDEFRETAKHGYYVLRECFDEAQRIHSQ
jgi:hypothetical protein